MIALQRYPQNPILTPNTENIWEHDGAFNGCVIEVDGTYHMVYRALSSEQKNQNVQMRLSTVGYATSSDGKQFDNRRQIIGPTEDWEKYGCEDPRITYFNGKFYIFYTALSLYPFRAEGIKTAVAITKDFKTFEKHPVTPFNSKAMGLFPDTVNGKMAALLTINTDLPPAKIAIALFDREEDLWSPHYWEDWYENANQHLLHLLRDIRDQVELGCPPIKTDDGWVFLYSYIDDYMSNDKHFSIEAGLLDLTDPRKIVGRTEYSLISPEALYEIRGDVPNIVFPSGGLIKDKTLSVYYGAADTVCALATCDSEALLKELKPRPHTEKTGQYELRFHRFAENPIIEPIIELEWQAAGTFNPAAICLKDKVHIIYRAQSRDGISCMGYASSTDGFHIEENLDYPIYVPRESFEKPTHPGNAGCEDPRITKIDDKLYMTYTAYDGTHPPRIALTSITVDDFLNKAWNWSMPKLISLPDVDDKDACIIKSKLPGKYIAFHRLGDSIWVDETDSLDFGNNKFLTGEIIAHPRKQHWDNAKLGIAAPPIETDQGWLLLYHGVSHPGNIYKVGAVLLDLMDPRKIIGRTDYPLFGPETPYELEGQVGNVVFPCGAVVINDTIFIYYGGADSVTGVATLSLKELLDVLVKK